MVLLRSVSRFLNGITMYALVLWGLRALAAVAMIFGFLGIISYNGISIVLGCITAVTACIVFNVVFAKALTVPVNKESAVITGLILFFVLSPVQKPADALALAAAALLATASKYVIAPGARHIFNPAAFGAAVLGLFAWGGGVWWVGTPALMPFTLVLGILIVWKIRRFALFLATLGASVVTAILLGLTHGIGVWESLMQHFLSWPILFFASVMVTEPLTTPPVRRQQVIYGLLAGALSSWPLNLVAHVWLTPELTLCILNVFSWAVSLKRRLFLTLREKKEIARGTWEFVFECRPQLAFTAGQYLEWTLPHKSDNRGNRRYFTIASSPTEKDVRLGVRIGEKSSSFKKALLDLQPGDRMVAGQLMGDFTLPEDPRRKLAFIAGGIGITPFRSHIRWLMDKGERRDIVLFYANRTQEDVAYRDLLDEAGRAIGLKTVYVIGGTAVDASMMARELPDFRERTFYLSGPGGMVDAYVSMLTHMGVQRTHIVTDYFPGFA